MLSVSYNQDQAQSLRDQQRQKRSQQKKADFSKRARRIVVTSGKGGVGKSNISLNLSIAFAKLNKKVLLIDADTNLANIDILLGLSIKKTLADVIFGNSFFSEVMVSGPEGIKILPGSSGIVEMLEKKRSIREKLITAFEEFENIYDIIIIDTGAGLSENVLQFVQGADDVILVTNSEPTSITDAYAMVKVGVHRNPNLEMNVIINLAQNRNSAEDTFEKLQLATRNFLQAEIRLLGFLPADPNIPIAVSRQEPFITLFPRSAATTALMMIARKLMKIPLQPENKAGFLTRIFQQKGN